MTPTVEIIQALVSAGYLEQGSAEDAGAIISNALRNEAPLEERAEALRDEDTQDQMIDGAREYAEYDAAVKDKKDLSIDKSIIQDAKGKKQVDELTRRHAEKRIAAACKSAAKSLAHYGLIKRSHVKDAAGLIQETWLESTG